MKSNIRFRHNVMRINSIEAFENIRGGIDRDCKDVYFVRMAGVNSTLVSEVTQMDRRMTCKEGMVYCRIAGLPILNDQMAVTEYEGYYEAWLSKGKEAVSTRLLTGNAEYEALLAAGIKKVLSIYASNKMLSASMEKNFIIKMLFWHDFVLTGAMREWNQKVCVKLVLSNLIKKQEYLFACLLTFLGYDVLLLQTEGDISESEELLGFSQKIVLGSFAKVELPAYDRAKLITEQKQNVKSFEELALLASSVVLIAIHNAKGDIIGTGSGIMIGRDGYILTNSHVASGGAFYSIRIEDEETVYSTDELIKYHSVIDLAILRIDRKLNPLPIYQGKKPLVRGQKVVAIGSPLGLFNSVSDGIISGFRKIDEVDMIQFTAPTSHGSSGGALLNLYGEVIGISTAGFDNAQNINLAVGYESIQKFIRGFV